MRSTRSRTRPRCAASRVDPPLQHPERRHLPLASALRLARVPLVDVDGTGTRFRFDALGTDKPLFNAPRTEQDVTHLAEPLDVPVPLLRRFTKAHLKELYGAGRSLLLEAESAADVERSPSPTSASATSRTTRRARHVGSRPRSRRHARRRRPGAGTGRVRGRARAGETRLATFHYGSALAVGGGGYDRAKSLELMHTVVPVEGGGPLGPPLASVAGGGAVQIQDNRTYAAPATITATTPAPNADDRDLVLRSANRTRPASRMDQLRLAMDPDTTIVSTAWCSRARRW